MATPRTIVAEQIQADNTGYKVYAFPYFPAEVREPVVSVWRTDVAASPDSPNLIRHSLQVQVYAGATLEEKAEAELDELLDAVLLSLQRLPSIGGVTSERVVFGDESRGQFTGWKILCFADSANVYKQTVLSEGA